MLIERRGLCRSGRLHARCRLCADRSVPGRAGDATWLELLDPDRYKGLASYCDIGDTRNGAWSYRAPFDEVARIADLVSFYPEKVTITIDVDEIGGIQLAEDAAAAKT